MINLVLSERQKPRALELYKLIYSAHIADPNCPYGGDQCPMMVDLKAQITALEEEGIKAAASWNSGVE